MPEVRSAVVLVETDENYVLQQRPNLPGQLAYPGLLQLLGGHAEGEESLIDAARRELGEETTLNTEELDIEPIWEGPYVGEGKHGEPLERYVGLFRVYIGSLAIRLARQEQGDLVQVPKNAEALQALSNQMTPFALAVLIQVIQERE